MNHPVYTVAMQFKAKYGFVPQAYKAAVFLAVSVRLADKDPVQSVIALLGAMRNGYDINS